MIEADRFAEQPAGSATADRPPEDSLGALKSSCVGEQQRDSASAPSLDSNEADSPTSAPEELLRERRRTGS